MTIQEYSNLMGYKELCTMEEYTEANLAYMMAGEMDKQTFCREYKKIGSSPLVRALALYANSKEVNCCALEAKQRQTALKLVGEAFDIRRIHDVEGAEVSAEAIDELAAQLIGRKDCIKHKLAKGYTLGQGDNDYIQDNLK